MNSQAARSSRSLLQALGLGFLLLGFLSLLFLPMPSHTFLWKAVNNFGHVPLFGFAAILLLWISRKLTKPSSWSSIRHYGLALLGVLALAFLTEGLQSFDVARQTSLSDIFHDLLGAICGLALFFTYDVHLPEEWVAWRRFPRNFILQVCVIVVLTILFLPVLEWAYVYWDRANRFPSLLQFSSEWEMKFVKETDSELQVVDPPVGWEKSIDDLVGKVEFHPKKYPGFRLEDPSSDWRGYTYLQFDIFSELSHLQKIAIRIDDAEYNHTNIDGFSRRIMISPGLNHIQISLDEIRVAPVSREMDLSAIRRVLWFASSPAEEFTLYFDNIRLE